MDTNFVLPIINSRYHNCKVSVGPFYMHSNNLVMNALFFKELENTIPYRKCDFGLLLEEQEIRWMPKRSSNVAIQR